MKKVFNILLSVSVILTLFNCSPEPNPPTPTPNPTTPPTGGGTGNTCLTQSNNFNYSIPDTIITYGSFGCNGSYSDWYNDWGWQVPESEYVSVTIGNDVFASEINSCISSGSDYGTGQSDCHFGIFQLFYPLSFSNISSLPVNTSYDFVGINEISNNEVQCNGVIFIEYIDNNGNTFRSQPMNDLNNYFHHIQSLNLVSEDSYDKYYNLKGHVKTILYNISNSSDVKEIEGDYSCVINFQKN